jgi:trans-L-3-hydroxyproline dehydratase
MRNVPSFVLALDQVIDVPGIGPVQYDIAFGGAFYTYVQAASIGLTCTPKNFAALVQKGMAISKHQKPNPWPRPNKCLK